MYLFKNLNFLDIKMVSEKNNICNGNCVGCSDMDAIIGGYTSFSEVQKFFDHLEEKKLINLSSLGEIVIFGVSIFDFPLMDLLIFLKQNKHLNLKIHVNLGSTDFIDNLKKIKGFEFLFSNVRFFLYKSYHKKGELDIEVLEKIVNFFNENGLKFQFDIIANGNNFDLEYIKSVFQKYVLNNKLGNSVNVEDNILLKGKKVMRNRCTVIDSYKIIDNSIKINSEEDLYLDISNDGKIRFHNLPCQWGKITVSNIYRSKREILIDFLRSKFFLISYLSSFDSEFGYKCYTCYNDFKYDYIKYI